MLDAEKKIFSGVIISGCDEDLYARGHHFSGSGLLLTSDPLTCVHSAPGDALIPTGGWNLLVFINETVDGVQIKPENWPGSAMKG